MNRYTTEDVEELKARLVNICLGCFIVGMIVGIAIDRWIIK